MALLPGKRLGEAITVPVAGGGFRFLFSTLLDAANPKFVVDAVKSAMRVGVSIDGSTTKLGKRLEPGALPLTLPSPWRLIFNNGHWLSMA
jgi:hypothetical protein